MIADLSALFGLLALAIASVGLYGVMSYMVVQRTSEIGIRMALGANRSTVLGIVLKSACALLITLWPECHSFVRSRAGVHANNMIPGADRRAGRKQLGEVEKNFEHLVKGVREILRYA